MQVFNKSDFQTKDELISFLVKNQDKIIAQKKAQIKHADGISVINPVSKAVKAEGNEKEVKVKAVINTTNWMDSHDDVHLPNLWDKSVRGKQERNAHTRTQNGI